MMLGNQTVCKPQVPTTTVQCDAQPHGHEPPEKANAAEFNKRQRLNARGFCNRNPVATMCVALRVLEVSVLLLHDIERAGSDNVARESTTRTMLTASHPASNLGWAWSGVCKDKAWRAARALLHPDAWAYLPPSARTWQACHLALAMLGALLCSLQQMIFAEWEGDLCLFGLLQPMQEDDLRAHAGNLLRKSKCELDTFTRRFLQRFDTIDKLVSLDSLATLAAVASVARVDNCRIECKHAVIRRALRQKASTHVPEFDQVAADFLLRHTRSIWHSWPRCAHSLAAKQPSQATKCKTSRPTTKVTTSLKARGSTVVVAAESSEIQRKDA